MLLLVPIEILNPILPIAGSATAMRMRAAAANDDDTDVMSEVGGE
ncbi:MAG: hypothetical protein ABW171_14685 [Steroidobacter sp.]